MRNRTLGQVLPNAAAAYGDKAALAFGGRSFSFNDLDAMSGSIANGLAARNIAAGDRVTLYAQNCWEWIVSYYAIAKTGAVINPISAMLTPDEVAYVVEDCGARAIVSSADKAEALLDIGANAGLEDVILFGGSAAAGAVAFEDLLRDGKTAFDIAAVDPDALSTICYTSGTTGHPKGAMQSHRNVVMNSALSSIMHGRTGADTLVSALPLPHAYGNVGMNSTMLYGMTMVLLPRFEETAVLAAIQEHRATLYDGVPTSYMMILAHPDAGNFDTGSLNRCTTGGQTMPAAKAQEFEDRFDCPLLELWGMTELSGVGIANSWYGENRHGSVGVTLPYMESRIADAEDAQTTLDRDEPGELMVRGPLVMQGYFGNEKATAETIEPDGWMHTGDIAKMDSDGYVWMVDRKKDMILTGGYNVYPAEIERVLARHPAVAMAGVGRLDHETKGEIAKAYIVLKPGTGADAEEIRSFCKQHLAAYKVPRAVQFVDALPITGTGKIMRRELATLDA